MQMYLIAGLRTSTAHLCEAVEQVADAYNVGQCDPLPHQEGAAGQIGLKRLQTLPDSYLGCLLLLQQPGTKSVQFKPLRACLTAILTETSLCSSRWNCVQRIQGRTNS